MNTLEENKKRVELLTLAKKQLDSEYAARRTTDHTKWASESSALWSLSKVTLPYPTAAVFPSETEIVARALLLYNNSIGNVVRNNQPVLDQVVEPEVVVEPEIAVEQVEQVVEPEIVVEKITLHALIEIEPKIVILEPVIDEKEQEMLAIVAAQVFIDAVNDKATDTIPAKLKNLFPSWFTT